MSEARLDLLKAIEQWQSEIEIAYEDFIGYRSIARDLSKGKLSTYFLSNEAFCRLVGDYSGEAQKVRAATENMVYWANRAGVTLPINRISQIADWFSFWYENPEEASRKLQPTPRIKTTFSITLGELGGVVSSLIDSFQADSINKAQAKPAPTKPKKSVFTKKERAILDHLADHHQYETGSTLDNTPLGVREIGEQVKVSPATVSNFFKKHFGGYKVYCVQCVNGRIGSKLSLLLGDTPGQRKCFGLRDEDGATDPNKDQRLL